jgi:alkylresorcinol/alkylpyrone synthase
MHDPRILAVATATPSIALRQGELRDFAARAFPDIVREDPRILEVFDNAEIETRYLCVPLDWLTETRTFAEKNARYVEEATRLGCRVARLALERAQLTPADIDHVVFVSSSGISTPSIDALIANQLDFRSDVRRTPLWGLGCAGGAVGLSRARDFALADPGSRVLVIALELCSLTFVSSDLSKRNLVATSLFADGAAAAVVAGSNVPRGARSGGPALSMLASQSMLWKDTLDVMGWELEEAGLRVVFSRSIPSMVVEHVRPSMEVFLGAHGLTLSDVRHLVAHPGGIKVLRAYAASLGLAPDALSHAREVLRCYGNMSSPTCLFVLERFLAARDIRSGEYAVVMALGPGFSGEYVLVRGES